MLNNNTKKNKRKKKALSRITYRNFKRIFYNKKLFALISLGFHIDIFDNNSNKMKTSIKELNALIIIIIIS